MSTLKTKRRSGFTLVEVLVASTIVGTVFVAALMSMQVSSQGNEAADEVTTAIMLAQQVRTMVMNIPFRDMDDGDWNKNPGSDGSSPDVLVDDMDDLLGHTYKPPRSAVPIDASGTNRVGTLMTGYNDWSQTVSITYRNPSDIAELTHDVNSLPANADISDIAMVQVTIKKNDEVIYITEWIVANR
jgi:prepilin-type N-terminal cleavage/methylation domain-containing protein